MALVQRRGRVWLALMALGAVGLVGCDAQPGVAVNVGGTVITEQQVADVASDFEALQAALGADGTVPQAQVVRDLMLDQAMMQVLHQPSYAEILPEVEKVTKASVLKQLKELGAPADILEQYEAVDADPVAYRVLSDTFNQLVQGELIKAEDLDAVLTPENIQINPRYTQVDSKTGLPDYPWKFKAPATQEPTIELAP
ncbi:MAG: hypothetical protein LBO75_01410 [Bifidobacteriaceae bacterium]|jgi:hypothetical protein|nr:hypothetical protein [Bifidobacteriaceae bacterium]